MRALILNYRITVITEQGWQFWPSAFRYVGLGGQAVSHTFVMERTLNAFQVMTNVWQLLLNFKKIKHTELKRFHYETIKRECLNFKRPKTCHRQTERIDTTVFFNAVNLKSSYAALKLRRPNVLVQAYACKLKFRIFPCSIWSFVLVSGSKLIE